MLANKLRSGLTILGMTIGVASVIVLIAVGNGSSKAVQARIQSLGTNVLIVMPAASRAAALRSDHAASDLADQGRTPKRSQDSSHAPDVKSASPVVNATQRDTRLRQHQLRPSSFVGTTPSYLTAHGYTIAEGSRLHRRRRQQAPSAWR